MMNDTLMILGTHFIDENVISEYKKMRDTPNVDCLLAVNNEAYKADFKNHVENRIFFDVSVRCFFFDSKVHDELELPHFVNSGMQNFGNMMWSLADYRFYYVKKFFPNYKYYWFVDYDVFCNATDYSIFLKKFNNNSSDLLITHLRHEQKETSTWCWMQGIDWAYKDCEVYGSLFSVERLSDRAIDFLYQRRLEHKKIFPQKNPQNRWIFCELFVPTELMNNGFACENIDEPNITGTWYLNDSRFFLKQDGKLYHPIKYVKNKISTMQNQIDNLNLQLRKLFLITLLEKLQKIPAVGKNPLPMQINDKFTQALLLVNSESIAGGGVVQQFIIKFRFWKM